MASVSRPGAVGTLRIRATRARPQRAGAGPRRVGRPRRRLEDLISVGPAMLRDFELLGVHSVAQLAKRDPQRLYHELERRTGQRQDPCVLDTFCAAVAQARNPRLEAAQCAWWWWSRKRKLKDEKLKK
jgi:Pathogenicity locus